MTTDMGREAVRETVELAFRLEARDFVSALRARRKISRSSRLATGVLGLMFLAFALTAAAELAGGRVDLFPVLMMIYCGVGLAVTPVLQARRLARVAEVSGACRVTVDEEGVTVRAEHVTVVQEWGARPVYRETADSFALFSGDRNARCMTLLPKRALTDPADVDRLRSLLDRHITRA
ncbi:hypothetical protein [Streptomyces sp. NPDC127190]|uniref:hypothetical protein n=1 Tax=unclassified Streptomyces TaxID=2593676 RepID=UPI00362CBB66